MEIVKGAAATTLYGTEASGGVIQIFTKRGRSGRPSGDVELAGARTTSTSMGPEGDPTAVFLKKCRGPELSDLDIVQSLSDERRTSSARTSVRGPDMPGRAASGYAPEPSSAIRGPSVAAATMMRYFLSATSRTRRVPYDR